MNIELTVDTKRRLYTGFAKSSIVIPDLVIQRDIDISFDSLGHDIPNPSPIALDFLFVASVCYSLDKMVPRNSFGDRWTREFVITIPVSDPDKWQHVKDDLNDLLSFLSGDVWDLTFSKVAAPIWQRLPGRARPSVESRKPDIVCLFSGGLDSLAGLIDLLEDNPDKRVLLVSHYDAAAGEQEDLRDALLRHYAGRFRMLRTRMGLSPRQGNETTLRTRSLVFIALGMYAARHLGGDVPVYAYENGHIALNVPLTPSRAGSCSTRTMHPFYLDKLVDVLGMVGIVNPLMRPFEYKTKGECLESCRDVGVLVDTYRLSVSCSHATRRRYWVRKDARNCGYCMPCLIRRAALNKLGIDVGREYGVDVCIGELPAENDLDSGDDLRAFLDFIAHRKTDVEMEQDILRVATIVGVGKRAAMVQRAVGELTCLLSSKGTKSLKSLANVR